MNIVRFAAAGSGKTYGICQQAIVCAHKSKANRILMVTYTNRGKNAIIDELEAQNRGIIPKNIVVLSWYQFLLKELIKPYQACFVGINETGSLDFSCQNSQNKRNFVPTGEKGRYYTAANNIRSEEASNLALLLDEKSEHKVFERLEKVYSSIFFDEVQDLAGRDINILEKLFQSNIDTICVGDEKQATFQTHRTRTNRSRTGRNIFEFFQCLHRKGVVQIQEVLCSRRFNAAICNFANSVYPNDKNMTSSMTEKTEHDGVFIIAKKDAMVYFEHFSPQELRYDRRTSGTCGDGAVNFGECKGMTYNRCLIYANKTFVQFLKGQKLETPEKYYVAVTRARYSNTIIVDELFGAVGFEKCKIKIGEDEIDAEKYLGNLN